jgi:hypothetical protein
MFDVSLDDVAAAIRDANDCDESAHVLEWWPDDAENDNDSFELQ